MALIALLIEDVIINKWEITEEVIIFGRAKDCDIQIDDGSVSSKHARIVVEADPFLDDTQIIFIEDLKSTNGTKLNGKKVIKNKLIDGDLIKIGFNQFQFIDNNEANLDETAVILS